MSKSKLQSKPQRKTVFGELLGNLESPHTDPYLADVPTFEDSNVTAIPLDKIDVNPKQPRRYHNPGAHDALVRSVRERGVIQAITVRKIADRYELIAGERRFRAAKEVGETTIPAVVLEVDEITALEIATLENMAREDLNPVEETEAVLYLLEVKLSEPRDRVVFLLRQLDNDARGRTVKANISLRERTLVEAVFAAIGKYTPQSFVNNRLPILKYPKEVYDAVMLQGLPFRTAQPIATLPELEQRRTLIEKTISEHLTKEQVTALVQQMLARPKPVKNSELESRLGKIKTRATKTHPDTLAKVFKLLDQIEKLLN
jgi:ParB family transcriptional regulator, chromosome partitioning protein